MDTYDNRIAGEEHEMDNPPNDVVDQELLAELSQLVEEDGEEPERPVAAEAYGYPLPPDDFSALSLEEVRQWGKQAIDALVLVDTDTALGGNLGRHISIIEDWANYVLHQVVKAIGEHDPVLLAYSQEARSNGDEVVRAVESERGSTGVPPLPVNWKEEGF